MTFLPSQFNFNELPGNTIVPDLDPEYVFIQYLTRLYEDIAFAVNNKDNIAFTIPINDFPTDIPNLAQFGASIVAISGVDSTLPSGVWATAKSDENVAGTFFALITQTGTGDWAGQALLMSSTATNFQIVHTRPNVTGNFSIRIVSTI